MQSVIQSRVILEKAGILHRRCAKCKEFKPVSNFPKNPKMLGGVNAYCKPCSAIYQVERRQKLSDKTLLSQKEYFSAYYQAHKETIQLERRKQRDSNRIYKELQNRAWYEFNEALRRGIIKGQPLLCNGCWDINKIGEKYEAHHPNYNEPLKVIWLCKSCHRRVHRNGLGERFK